MVIRKLCCSLALLAVFGACSSDPGAGNGYIDLPAVGPSTASGGASASSAGAGGAVTSGGMSSVSAVLPSAGCAKPLPAGQTLGSYTKYTVHVTGVTLDPNFSYPAHDRDYYVWLPKDYDPTKPYRVTFIGYGCGNKYAGNTATYKLMLQDPESIYIGMNMPPDNIATQEGP
ncbi:MAG TPA: hypothetical protein VNW92_03265, partial [Polyangiaceae bacterium]|nr:hypothetical protein [Polyangiaceae bacterium]